MSSVRFHPLEKILDRAIYMLPLTMLGANESALMVWSTIEVCSGMFIHANTRFNIGPFIYLFVGPEMHQWHHALDPERQNSNFGNVLSIFDWLFGTAYLETARPREFGIPVPAYPQGNIIRQFLFAFRPMTVATRLQDQMTTRLQDQRTLEIMDPREEISL
jgi:sterol desaturase/sphingolipid hydroxylase (fatty acid hydroxylase superfamily)